MKIPQLMIGLLLLSSVLALSGCMGPLQEQANNKTKVVPHNNTTAVVVTTRHTGDNYNFFWGYILGERSGTTTDVGSTSEPVTSNKDFYGTSTGTSSSNSNFYNDKMADTGESNSNFYHSDTSSADTGSSDSNSDFYSDTDGGDSGDGGGDD